MSLVAVCLVAFLAAGLTLFSGFGLGTLLMPAFALAFPLPVAIAATAVVHLANSLFKLALVGRWADRRVVLRFGLPAIAAAFVGAGALGLLASLQPIAQWSAGPVRGTVTPVKLGVGALIVALALWESLPIASRLAFSPRWLPAGGALSGFLGGLSGHQGALRMAFLSRLDLTKEALIGTSAACAALVDVARLLVYALASRLGAFADLGERGWTAVSLACVAAFAGSLVAARLLRAVTLRAVRRVIAVALVVFGVALASGVI